MQLQKFDLLILSSSAQDEQMYNGKSKSQIKSSHTDYISSINMRNDQFDGLLQFVCAVTILITYRVCKNMF
jgi:hypothetical protein